MNFTIDTTDLDRVRRAYAQFSDRRFAAGLATALTRTAQAVQAAQRAEMLDVFDRPTDRTLGSVFVRPATAARLESVVGVADGSFSVGGLGRAPLNWLRWQISGGARTLKAFEKRLVSAGAMPDDFRAVPGKFARLDAFGNISGGQLRQIFSQLRIELSSGAKSTLPNVSGADRRLVAAAGRRSGFVGPLQRGSVADARRGVNRVDAAYRRAGGQFVAFPRGRGKLLPGIYQVRATAFGRSDPKPVIIYVRSALYEARRFDFPFVSQLAVQRHLPVEVKRAMEDQLRRWAAKYGG